MITGDIEHSELPDELLHEPKGASTASAGTVYIADGAGSGAFAKLPISSLDISISSVSSLPSSSITETVVVNGSTLSQIPDGNLTDVSSYTEIPQEFSNTINKNVAEVYSLYVNLKTINDEVKSELSTMNSKINELLTALKGVGIIDE